MKAKEAFKQAYRELRANGRIGYSVLGAPRMRDAAIEVLRMRLERDELATMRRPRERREMELYA